MVERAWPPLVFALAVVVFFWRPPGWGVAVRPRSFRIFGVVLFAVAGGIALSPLARLRRPAARDVLATLDRDAGTNHRPASSLADSLANDDGDPGTRALWAAHRARLERAVDAIRVAPPSPRMVERDPYAIRFGVALLAFAAAVAAGPEMYGRLAAAFDWRSDAGDRRRSDEPHRRLDRPAALRRPAAGGYRLQDGRSANAQRSGGFWSWWCAATRASSRRGSRAAISPSEQKANGRQAP